MGTISRRLEQATGINAVADDVGERRAAPPTQWRKITDR